jgi:hypothetical protein
MGLVSSEDTIPFRHCDPHAWLSQVEGLLTREMGRAMHALAVSFRAMDSVGAGTLQPPLTVPVCDAAGLDFGPGLSDFVTETSVSAYALSTPTHSPMLCSPCPVWAGVHGHPIVYSHLLSVRCIGWYSSSRA